ncbi:hypothetical protein MAR_018752 [Mya arenaria]|uniref:THAP-type domain-containing protein n=1 Tax=Mya arenaria TaxID=6604 RepID=A0ABY7EK61_MYAAR|nr:hypothetical protein MAR_018752 [Mya arenaria]
MYHFETSKGAFASMSIEEELCYGKLIVLFNVTAVLNLAHAQSVPGVANVINNKKQNVKNGEKLLCFRKPTSRKFCGEKKGIRFFKFPKGSHKRRSWIQAMNRKDWVPDGNSFFCSAYFVYGWHNYEAGDADYAPSVFSYKETAVGEKRQERAFRGDLSKCDTDPLIEENQHLREENERLRKELKMMKWGVNIIKDDDKATRFYSGLPTFALPST